MEPIKINVSVRDLVSFSIPAGDSRGFSLNSAKEGIEGHQIVHNRLKQEIEPSGTYKKEVPVSISFSHDIFLLQVSGRLDGLIETDNKYSLCEIKTTNKSLDSLEESNNPAHWAQCLCYAYIIAKEQSLDSITILLLYFHRKNKETRTFERKLTYLELEKFFHSLVYPYINGQKKQYDWQSLRNSSIQALSFPFPEFRKGQRAMSAAVYRAIRDGNRQFIKAPTGIGKTLGAMFPAIKAMGEGHIDKIFYLTARNTTQAIAGETYEMMARNGLRLKTLHITAKEKVCFSPDTSCNQDECSYLIDYPLKSKKAISLLFKKSDYFDRDSIEKAAKENNLCPFELSLDISIQADLIICDYNYAFDPRVYLKRFFQDKSDEQLCLLVDEAHNLPDRAREMYSAELKRSALRELYHKIKKSLPSLATSLKKVRKALLSYTENVPAKFPNVPLPWTTSYFEPPEELKEPIEKFLYHAEFILNDETPYPFKEELISLYFDLAHFLRIYDCFGDNYATLYCREQSDFTIKLFCIDPAPMLNKRIENSKSSIFYSATLSPAQYYKEILSDNKSDNYLAIPSPFPRENLYVYVDDTLSTKYRHRDSSLPLLIDRIHECISVKTGNYLVFFPSFAYMQKSAKLYAKVFPDDLLLIQEPNMDEEQRLHYLSHFNEYGENTLIAFAVMGGIFSEGIDIRGENLSGAIIVGVGLPQICVQRDIIKQYYQKKSSKGFEFAYTYPGLNKVQQAAGRVIRSENDIGFIILIDDRFTNTIYTKILPSEWFPLKTPRFYKNLSADLKCFWIDRKQNDT